MITKTFNGKKIKIRELAKSDLKKVKEFQDFINSLIKEEAKIRMNRKISFFEEKKWIKYGLAKIKKRTEVFLLAEYNNKIVGTTGVGLGRGRNSHVGNFGITIRDGYRGMGLGTYLGKEIIKLAKSKLKPKIIRLEAYPNNKPALALYKKLGFKKVGRIPKQIQYKGKLIDEIIMVKYL